MQPNQPNSRNRPHPQSTAMRPVASPRPQTGVSASAPVITPRTRSRRLSKKILLIGAVALVVLAAYLMWSYASTQIMGDRYQAVFLSNGQVYFGKLHDYYTGRPYMTDVYYFQANSQSGNSSQGSAGNQLLVKLGQEIHAPENKLILNTNSIMFVENLTDNGKVVEAIKKDAQGSNANSAPSGGAIR